MNDPKYGWFHSVSFSIPEIIEKLAFVQVMAFSRREKGYYPHRQ